MGVISYTNRKDYTFGINLARSLVTSQTAQKVQAHMPNCHMQKLAAIIYMLYYVLTFYTILSNMVII